MKRALLCMIVAGCGDTESPQDALVGCAVVLSGNFIESVSSMMSCPTLAPGAGSTQGDMLLQFTVPSQQLGAKLSISLDLGQMPTPGAYNSGTTDLWTAMGVKAVAPRGACL